jgi:hypothetical protein
MNVLDMDSETFNLRAEEERILAYFTQRLIEIAAVPGATKDTDNEHSQVRTSRFSQDRLFRFWKGCALRLHPFPV